MINNNLKQVRKNRGMSKAELSRRSKISRVTITKIEEGESNPKASTINSICKALGENPTKIFFAHSVNHE